MRVRVWTWVLLLGMALPIAGCPGDGEGEAMGGTGGNASGDGDGDGDSGTGGAAGQNGGSGGGDGPAGSGGGGSTVTPEQAAMGACEMGGGEGSECEGIDEYQACLETMCGVGACYDGPCASLLTCYQNAADPCEANCMPSDECTTCFTDKLSCLSGCASNLVCDGMPVGGETMPGGGCDQLDDCCASLDSQMMMACTALAGSVRLAGDEACAMLIPSYCPGSG